MFNRCKTVIVCIKTSPGGFPVIVREMEPVWFSGEHEIRNGNASDDSYSVVMCKLRCALLNAHNSRSACSLVSEMIKVSSTYRL